MKTGKLIGNINLASQKPKISFSLQRSLNEEANSWNCLIKINDTVTSDEIDLTI